MAGANATGPRGEDAAARFLCRKGYRIRERNYRCRFGEIDIVAEGDGYLVFAEVKTRKEGAPMLPREAVDAHKRARLIKTAGLYLSCHAFGSLQPRFDVVEVFTRGGAVAEINLLENAFSLS